MINVVKLFCFGLLTLIYGCLPGMGEWEITLYEQKIEGTSKAIYKYDAWGGRDSHEAGYAILDTTEIFKIPALNNISLDYLIEIPTENIIEVAVFDDVPYKEMKKMKETYFPIQLEEKEIQGIKIKTKHYQEKGYRQAGGGGLNYEFSDFRETKDSIYFYDLNYVIYKYNSRHRDSVKVKKGQDVNEQLLDIEIKKLIISELVNDSLILYKYSNFRETKDSICIYDLNYHTVMKQLLHRDSVKEKKGHVIIRQFKNKEIIEIEIKKLIFSEFVNDSLISKWRNVFKPKNKVKSTEFSDYGIFKEKITVPNNVYKK
jgi:hypothetical protein